MRVGMLTSGGDCQSLNATMRGVAKALYEMYDDVEIIGFEDGYKGLIYMNYRIMQPEDFSGILTEGGTILGTSRQPFKLMRVHDENDLDKVEAMKHTYKKLRLECLVVLGGNGSQKTANLLREEGLNVIGLPKTIDNDLWGHGHDLRFPERGEYCHKCHRLHPHNGSFSQPGVHGGDHGHGSGWLTLNAGMAGGADIILIPEIPYDINSIIGALKKREKAGKAFSIIAVAEGAISKEDAQLTKKELKKKREKAAKDGRVFPSVSYEIGAQIEAACGLEVRVTVPGHMQRGGSPCAYDRVLSSRLGAEAAKMISKKEYGYMVAVKSREISKTPLEEVAGKLKTVDPNASIIEEARLLGISFGDESIE